jgi:hypothetical protein
MFEFALAWIDNFYMGAFNRMRLEIKAGNLSIAEQSMATKERDCAPATMRRCAKPQVR